MEDVREALLGAITMKVQSVRKIKLDDKVPVYDLVINSRTPCFSLAGGIISHNTVPWKSELRDNFVPRTKRSIMVHWDYAAAEVKVLATLANCQSLKDAFARGLDIHRFIASKVWKKPMDQITDGERRFSKMAVFSKLYGSSVRGFAMKFMQGDIAAAQAIFDGFDQGFPEIAGWVAEKHRTVLADNYVTTLFGDKLRIKPYSNSRGDLGAACRKAMNYPVQSTSSSIAGYVGWKAWKEFQRYGIKAVPMLFTHDSQDWEVDIKHLRVFTMLTRRIAVDWVRETFGVPCEIDFDIGMTQNNMMSLEHAVNEGPKSTFEFKCPESTFPRLIKELGEFYTIDYKIEKTKIVHDTADELFMTKRAYSRDIGKDIKHLAGHITLTDRSDVW